MPADTLRRRTPARAQWAVAVCALIAGGLVGIGGVAFADQEDAAWTTTARMTVRVETDEPERAVAVVTTTSPAAVKPTTSPTVTERPEPVHQSSTPAPTSAKPTRSPSPEASDAVKPTEAFGSSPEPTASPSAADLN